MIDELRTVIDKKFTRCPECRSFSVRQIDELTTKEKFKGIFVPVTAHICGNCNYRFVEYGRFSDRLKELLTGQSPQKYLILATPLLVAVILVLVLLLAGGKEKLPHLPPKEEPARVIEKKPPLEKIPPMTKEEPATKPVEKTGEQPRQEQSPDLNEEQTPPPETTPVSPAIAGQIVLGNSNRFGVNWRPVEQGVAITKLSEGAMKRAGFLEGDIIIAVDGKDVRGEGGNLEKARDEVFMGKRPGVLITVKRNNQTLTFEMIKYKKKKK